MVDAPNPGLMPWSKLWGFSWLRTQTAVTREPLEADEGRQVNCEANERVTCSDNIWNCWRFFLSLNISKSNSHGLHPCQSQYRSLARTFSILLTLLQRKQHQLTRKQNKLSFTLICCQAQGQGQSQSQTSNVKTRPWGRVCNGLAHHPPGNFFLA